MTRGRALTLALLVTLLWSTSFVLTKIALRSMGPLWLGFLRYESAGLILVLVSLPHTRRAIRSVGVRRILGLGILGYALAQGPFIFGLYHSSRRRRRSSSVP